MKAALPVLMITAHITAATAPCVQPAARLAGFLNAKWQRKAYASDPTQRRDSTRYTPTISAD
jgi:hypothetical protein